MTSIAVIGAGITGLVCADRLAGLGHDVTVFEKSRSRGGRIATRRADHDLAFDHGAQFVTARSVAFRELLNAAKTEGHVTVWRPRRHPEMLAAVGTDWYVGTPNMSALVAGLATQAKLLLNSRVTSLELTELGWRVHAADVDHEWFDRLVVALPAPQARALLGESLPPLVQLDRVRMAPCWAAMLAFESPLEVDWDAWSAPNNVLSLVVRDTSKPGRTTQADTWVLHADAGWSDANLALAHDEISQQLIAAFEDLVGIGLPPTWFQEVHRWRYARTTAPLGKPFLALPEMSLHVGGDWCLGARVECGFESGQGIASDIQLRLAGGGR